MQKNETKVPKYQLIENDIIEKINSGIYQAGDSIPSETELVEIYNCSRVTVRQALGNLAYKGFLIKKHGSGTYVNKPKIIQRNPFIKSFTEDMEENGKKVTSIVHAFSITKATDATASLLGIQPNDFVYYIERTRYADDDAILFEKTYMSVDLHPDMSIKVLKSSKYQYAKKEGLIIECASQNIIPIFPPDYIASELKISTKQPMLKVVNITYLEDGRVFDYTELYLHPELYQLNFVKYK